MKKLLWLVAVFLVPLASGLMPAWATESPMYTLSAKVSQIEPENSVFFARFEHPATGENLEYRFQVTERTGMNGLKHVRELKSDDLLQIDYFKTADGSLIVEYMARVKLKGAPEGLEEFNPAELFKQQ
jgi:hypothetical protein